MWIFGGMRRMKIRMVNNNIIFLFLMIIFIGLVSANPIVGEEFDIKIICINDGYCSNASYCNINVILPNSTLIVDGQNMTNQGSFHNYTILPEIYGEYKIGGFCKDEEYSQEIDYSIFVTADGETYDTGDSLVRIFVAIFFVLMMLGFYRVTKNVNYEKWYEKIKKQYITRNSVKFALAAIMYNIMINSYIIYFMLGLPIMLIITDLAFIYNITSILLYVEALLYVYISMVIVLGVVFLSFAQEWFMDLVKQVQDINWGLDK